MIGLVVIVLILVIIGLIFLKFYLSSHTGLDSSSVFSIKANNLANAIKFASVCNGDLSDAVIACCNQKIFCNQNACEFSNNEIKKIIDKSIEEEVYFEAKSQDSLCFSINKECTGISSTQNLIRNQDGESKISLKICA